ncbi:hypothetical protein GCM10009554_05750 [Kribbella koreensis]|uniref:Uncharacterized protein n=1 Tax=Kribbella koreensis TaxID=57909 RepID=A0ABN1PC35_9ACTN
MMHGVAGGNAVSVPGRPGQGTYGMNPRTLSALAPPTDVATLKGTAWRRGLGGDPGRIRVQREADRECQKIHHVLDGIGGDRGFHDVAGGARQCGHAGARVRCGSGVAD